MMTTDNGEKRPPLTTKQSNALTLLVQKERMVVGWKNTPHIVASGTAKALVDRGLAQYSFGYNMRSDYIEPTDAGRAARSGRPS